MTRGGGRLVLVGTPLGHRGDLSPRARETLLTADLLLCEDTRSVRRLLGSEVPLPPRMSCFVGNEIERVGELLARLDRGETVAYVSEAGMPVWSDPGERLVAAAVEAGFEVDVVPGPTAAAVAVCHSGFESRQVRFVGFPPRGGAERRALLESVANDEAVTVFYEAGNRCATLVRDLAELVPEPESRRIVVARELTKLHQEVMRETVSSMLARVDETMRGEVTVVLEGRRAAPVEEDEAQVAARTVLDAMLDPALKPRERARVVAGVTGLDARDVYRRLSASR